MPEIRVTHREPRTPEQRRIVADALSEAVRAAIGCDRSCVTVQFLETADQPGSEDLAPDATSP